MGIVRSWLFRLIYPLPQKGEDLLAYKKNFIEEYVGPYRLKLEMKEVFVPYRRRETVCYAKTKHDKEQKKHAEAYKTWKKLASTRQRD